MVYLKLYFRQKWREYHETDRRVCKKYSGFSGTGNYIQRRNKHPSGCRWITSGDRLMQEKLKDVDFDVVVGPESRGFIFGVPIAYNLHKPFIPIRKKENSHARRFLLNMNWSMAQPRSRCTKMQSSRAESGYY